MGASAALESRSERTKIRTPSSIVLGDAPHDLDQTAPEALRAITPAVEARDAHGPESGQVSVACRSQ